MDRVDKGAHTLFTSPNGCVFVKCVACGKCHQLASILNSCRPREEVRHKGHHTRVLTNILPVNHKRNLIQPVRDKKPMDDAVSVIFHCTTHHYHVFV